jgi:preprotein translocase subunit SecD
VRAPPGRYKPRMRFLFPLLLLLAASIQGADGTLAISACAADGAPIGEPVITDADVATAIVSTAVMGQRQERSLRLTMTREGGAKARAFTRERLKQRISIVIGGVVVSTPVVIDVSGPDWFLSFPADQEELVQRFVAEIRAR